MTSTASSALAAHSLRMRYPLEGDGVTSNLFHYLWTKDALGRGPAGLLVPHTVIYRFREPVAWFFTSRDGSIKRKNKSNLVPDRILQGLLRVRGECEVVAVFIHSGPQDGDGQRIEYLDEEALHALVTAARPPKHGILQQFVEPKGAHNTMVRSIWAPKLCVSERRINVKRLGDARVPLYERAVTYEGAEHNSVAAPIRGVALPRKVQQTCEGIVFHVAQVTDLKVRVSRMVASFRVDPDGRLWFLYCTSLRAEGQQGDGPDAAAITATSGAAAIQSMRDASRTGLTQPASRMGELTLGRTAEPSVPPERQQDLTGNVRPMLAPGQSAPGAAAGAAAGGGGLASTTLQAMSTELASMEQGAGSQTLSSTAGRGGAHAQLGPRGLPLLKSNQCPSCGATNDMETNGEHKIHYKVVVAHYEQVLKSMGLIAHRPTKEESRGWQPLHGLPIPRPSRWPDQLLSLNASAGVGLFGLFLDQSLIARRARGEDVNKTDMNQTALVPWVDEIPPMLSLLHPRMAAADFRALRRDPLFQFKSAGVCEACFLVFARFAAMLVEGRAPKNALMDIMSPVAKRQAIRRQREGPQIHWAPPLPGEGEEDDDDEELAGAADRGPAGQAQRPPQRPTPRRPPPPSRKDDDDEVPDVPLPNHLRGIKNDRLEGRHKDPLTQWYSGGAAPSNAKSVRDRGAAAAEPDLALTHQMAVASKRAAAGDRVVDHLPEHIRLSAERSAQRALSSGADEALALLPGKRGDPTVAAARSLDPKMHDGHPLSHLLPSEKTNHKWSRAAGASTRKAAKASQRGLEGDKQGGRRSQRLAQGGAASIGGLDRASEHPLDVAMGMTGAHSTPDLPNHLSVTQAQKMGRSLRIAKRIDPHSPYLVNQTKYRDRSEEDSLRPRFLTGEGPGALSNTWAFVQHVDRKDQQGQQDARRHAATERRGEYLRQVNERRQRASQRRQEQIKAGTSARRRRGAGPRQDGGPEAAYGAPAAAAAAAAAKPKRRGRGRASASKGAGGQPVVRLSESREADRSRRSEEPARTKDGPSAEAFGEFLDGVREGIRGDEARRERAGEWRATMGNDPAVSMASSQISTAMQRHLASPGKSKAGRKPGHRLAGSPSAASIATDAAETPTRGEPAAGASGGGSGASHDDLKPRRGRPKARIPAPAGSEAKAMQRRRDKAERRQEKVDAAVLEGEADAAAAIAAMEGQEAGVATATASKPANARFDADRQAAGATAVGKPRHRGRPGLPQVQDDGGDDAALALIDSDATKAAELLGVALPAGKSLSGESALDPLMGVLAMGCRLESIPKHVRTSQRFQARVALLEKAGQQAPTTHPLLLCLRRAIPGEFVPSDAQVREAVTAKVHRDRGDDERHARKLAGKGAEAAAPPGLHEIDPEMRGAFVLVKRDVLTGCTWREFLPYEEVALLPQPAEGGEAEEELHADPFVARGMAVLQAWRREGKVARIDDTLGPVESFQLRQAVARRVAEHGYPEAAAVLAGPNAPPEYDSAGDDRSGQELVAASSGGGGGSLASVGKPTLEPSWRGPDLLPGLGTLLPRNDSHLLGSAMCAAPGGGFVLLFVEARRRKADRAEAGRRTTQPFAAFHLSSVDSATGSFGRDGPMSLAELLTHRRVLQAGGASDPALASGLLLPARRYSATCAQSGAHRTGNVVSCLRPLSLLRLGNWARGHELDEEDAEAVLRVQGVPRGTLARCIRVLDGRRFVYHSLRISEGANPAITIRRHSLRGGHTTEMRLPWGLALDPNRNPFMEAAALDVAAGYWAGRRDAPGREGTLHVACLLREAPPADEGGEAVPVLVSLVMEGLTEEPSADAVLDKDYGGRDPAAGPLAGNGPLRPSFRLLVAALPSLPAGGPLGSPPVAPAREEPGSRARAIATGRPQPPLSDEQVLAAEDTRVSVTALEFGQVCDPRVNPLLELVHSSEVGRAGLPEHLIETLDAALEGSGFAAEASQTQQLSLLDAEPPVDAGAPREADGVQVNEAELINRLVQGASARGEAGLARHLERNQGRSESLAVAPSRDLIARMADDMEESST